ncbi:MAG: hypothetical protein ACYS32_10850 [Planctomycetota bacterium]|jgi:hypothetical protein
MSNKKKIWGGFITLILIDVIALFLTFAVGVIHPSIVLDFEFLRPFLEATVIIIFIIYIVKLIVTFIRNLFKPEKKILTNFCKIALCFALLYIFLFICGFSHEISFVGLRVHYWFVKDYDTIRTWANNVEIPEKGFLYTNGIDIPEPAKPFHPENVEIKEEESVRRLYLSWNSGFMQVGWTLIICPIDDTYQVESGTVTKIQPGVYLHYEFYEH